jgi:DNA-directed RNA polymerase subunit RPC12/RpoP
VLAEFMLSCGHTVKMKKEEADKITRISGLWCGQCQTKILIRERLY